MSVGGLWKCPVRLIVSAHVALGPKQREQHSLMFFFLFFFLSSFKLTFSLQCPFTWFSALLQSDSLVPTASSSIINLTTSRCLLCFCPQLLDLFMVWDWSTYLADYGQPSSKYLRVNPATALALLEKWVPSMNQHFQGKRARSFLSFWN